MPKELLLPVICIAIPFVLVVSIKLYHWISPGTLPPFDVDAFIEQTVIDAEEQEDQERLDKLFRRER